MEMVINAIYYNPRLSVHVLESNGWTNKFFSLWFSSIDSFTRVHDKKLSIGAITQLLTLRADEVPQSVQQGWPRLLQGVTRLFQTLPAALRNREEAQREEDFGLGDDFDDEEEDDEWEGEDWDHEETEEALDVKDESTAYLDFLSQQASKFNSVAGDDDEDDELEEESLLETPLDQMEPYGLFKAALQCKSLLIHLFSCSRHANNIVSSSVRIAAPALLPAHRHALARRAASRKDGRRGGRQDRAGPGAGPARRWGTSCS